MMNAISIRNQNAVDERAKNFLTEAEMSSFLKVACKAAMRSQFCEDAPGLSACE